MRGRQGAGVTSQWCAGAVDISTQALPGITSKTGRTDKPITSKPGRTALQSRLEENLTRHCGQLLSLRANAGSPQHVHLAALGPAEAGTPISRPHAGRISSAPVPGLTSGCGAMPRCSLCRSGACRQTPRACSSRCLGRGWVGGSSERGPCFKALAGGGHASDMGACPQTKQGNAWKPTLADAAATVLQDGADVHLQHDAAAGAMDPGEG